MKKHVWVVAVTLAVVNLVAVIFGRDIPGTANYGQRLFIAFDLLANAVAGGNHLVTISARVGYMSAQAKKSFYIWDLCERIINGTFKPIDGPNHCWNAYLWTKKTLKLAGTDSLHINHGPNYMLYILLGIVVLSCIVLYLPIKAISFLTSS
jgi:hypothetical protein